jgi:hypothetical protein
MNCCGVSYTKKNDAINKKETKLDENGKNKKMVKSNAMSGCRCYIEH